MPPTYRQLDHWARLGLLHPINGDTPGYGHPREWPADELAIANIIGELRKIGLELPVAADCARRFVAGETAITLSPTITLTRSVDAQAR